jgi:lysophospholipase L1-like esterase
MRATIGRLPQGFGQGITPRRPAAIVLAIVLAVALALASGFGRAANVDQPAQQGRKTAAAFAASVMGSQIWAAAWAASPQGPYPSGNATAQPELRFALPSPEAGATDQTFRLIVRPDVWGPEARIRLSNVFGTKPLTFDGVFIGLAGTGGAVVAGTNTHVRFAGESSVTVAPGASAWSDAVAFAFASDRHNRLLDGRHLAVSFHVAGESGPMTWHAKALTTSYISPPHSGAQGEAVSEAAFPYSTTSWFFLDALDMRVPSDTRVIAAFGDSITDGTSSTLNGDDRWPDVLARRLHAAFGNRVSVVNEGIGGNQVVGPAEYPGEKPYPGGPSAAARVDRDVFGLSGLSEIIWLEGINDYNAGTSTDDVIAGIKELARRAHERNVPFIAGTLTPALHATLPTQHGSDAVEAKRRAQNDFIRESGIFDGVVDFDAVTRNPESGEIKAEFQPGSTVGGPGDKLHPNRAGYMAMGEVIDLKMLMPPPKVK